MIIIIGKAYRFFDLRDNKGKQNKYNDTTLHVFILFYCYYKVMSYNFGLLAIYTYLYETKQKFTFNINV